MEDFIIILIGFALMAYSAYSRNRKAKNDKGAIRGGHETSSEGQQAGGSSEKKDVLEELFGYEPEQENHPFAEEEQYNEADSSGTPRPVTGQYENKRQPAPATEKQSYEPLTYKKINEEGGVFHGKAEKSQTPEAFKKSYKKQDKRKRHHWFNLRNAVIYSEIMHRKY